MKIKLYAEITECYNTYYYIMDGSKFVIGRQMKIYIVCALIWVMVTVIFTIIILLGWAQYTTMRSCRP